MNINNVFLVAGGDLRQAHLANMLSKNALVYALGFDNNVELDEKIVQIEAVCEITDKVSYIIFPIPPTNDSLHVNMPLSHKHTKVEDVLSVASDKTVIFAGKADEDLKKSCKIKHLELVDYLEREELSVLNAVPTAEGAIQLAMEEMPITLFGSKVLVTGFGRISKVLVKILTGLSADVTVTARKYSDLAWVKVHGCKAVHIKDVEQSISEYDLVINTVPAMILGSEILGKLKEDCLVIDLASKPGGVDFEIAKNLGIKTIWALSLPGKVAPISAGEIIYDTICNILCERGESE
ncbi:MAG: shikimate/quinate 5-dehydrogenase [Oscillospiraceae bacterium]|jgi:dipicolinate synthase subunit A|nr:shikimate/quinate 5-dehydrogenase [Oscillospiraceae bacterium]